MPVIPYKGMQPEIPSEYFIAPTAWVSGKVILGEKVSILFGASLRGDIQYIRIGDRTNVQDNAVIHTSRGLNDCIIGHDVTIGHSAILHGCTVRDFCIIGMGSTILDDAVIGEECIIGANSLVTMRTQIPPRSLAVGSPAKVVRQLTDRELKELRDSAESYVNVGAEYAKYFRALK